MIFRNSPHPADGHEKREEPGSMDDSSPEVIRSYRTRGWLMPLCGILTAMIFCLTVPAWYALCKTVLEPMYCLLAGVLLSAAAIPFHVAGGSEKASRLRPYRRLFYLVSILLNAVGSACCMTAYYIYLSTAPISAVLFAAILPSAVIHGLTALLMQIMPRRYALLTGALAVLTLALLIVAIVFWVRNDNKVFFSFSFFNLLWALISVVALHVACSDEGSPALRFASFASFGILLGVAAIVMIILVCASGDCDCDGSCCDCGDCGCRGKESPTNRAGKKKHI